MKKILNFITVLIALATGMTAFAAQFTDGNIVVYRVGDGVATLTNSGNRVFLDEYRYDSVGGTGVLVQTIPMPTNYFGAYSPLIGAGTAFGNGLITRSVDGRFILVPGYGATLGQFTNSGLQGNFASSVPRVTGLVDGQGNTDTTTVQTNSARDNVELRSATSDDGTNIWTGGDSGGIRYQTRGSVSSIDVSSSQNNIRQLNIFNNQLYFDINNPDSFTQSVFVVSNTVANTLPMATNGVTNVVLSAVTTPNPEAFLMLKLNAGGADPLDTLYISNAGSVGGNVEKYSLVSGTWQKNGILGTFNIAIGLAGKIRIVGTTTNVDLYISQGGTTLTGGNNIAGVTDTNGYNAAPGFDPPVLIVSGITGKAFRGIVMAPTTNSALALPSGAGRLSVGPAINVFAKASTGCLNLTETNVYSLANPGTSSIDWTGTVNTAWVTLSSSNGTLGSMTSANVTVTLGDITGLTAATNTATITFSNKTSAVGTTTRAVTLFLDPQELTPASSFSATGDPGGPFTPSNRVYTVTTGPAITLIVSKENASTWLNLNGAAVNAATVSLGACSSTIITASINSAVATNLAAADYTDTIIFSNATAGTVLGTRSVLLQVGFRYFCDDFSTYEQNTFLAGQNGWVTSTGSANRPVVTNNAVYVTATTTGAAGEDPYKNFPQLLASSNATASMFCSMSITVTSAAPVAQASPSQIWTFLQNNNAGGYVRDTLTVRDTGTGTFVFAIRNNTIPANAFVFGTTALNYNTAYNVIIQGEVGNTNSYVYVNPVSSTLDTNTAYVKMTLVSGADPNVGSVKIRNVFSSLPAGNAQAGIAISKMCVTTNYADAYNFSITIPPGAYTTWQTFYFGCTGCAQAQGGADPDGDGMSNTNEFLAGFNPTNSSARLKITDVVRTDGTNVTLTYLGASGDSSGSPGPKTNVLDVTTGTPPSYSNNFVSAGQTNVLTGGTGLGTVATFVHTNGATGPARYYRIRVLVP